MMVKRDDGTIVVRRLKIADNFFSRFKGLMGTKELREGEGLLIMPCNGIHMFWMRYSVDAIFLNQSFEIVHLERDIRPWRVSPIIKNARMVLEVPENTIDTKGLSMGDKLNITELYVKDGQTLCDL